MSSLVSFPSTNFGTTKWTILPLSNFASSWAWVWRPEFSCKMASSFATKTNPFHIFLTIPTVICVDIPTPARMQLQPVHRLIGDRADLFSLVALPEFAGGPVIQGSGAGGFQALETPHFGLLWFLGSSVLQVRRKNRNDRGDLYRRGEGIFGELLGLCSMYDCIIYCLQKNRTYPKSLIVFNTKIRLDGLLWSIWKVWKTEWFLKQWWGHG